MGVAGTVRTNNCPPPPLPSKTPLLHLTNLLRLSTAAKKAGARDDTEYHDPPGSKRLSFKEHWARELSAAAALGDAARIASKLKRVLRSSSHGARSA